MGPQVTQAYSVWQIMLDKVTSCLREQHLPAVTSTHDVSRTVDIQAHVAFGTCLWLTGVQPHAHADFHPLGPGMSGNRALGLHRRRDGITGTCKGHEEALALRIDFVALTRLERRAQQVTALGQHIGVALSDVLELEHRPLDIAQEQRDRSRRKMMHGKSPWADPDDLQDERRRRLSPMTLTISSALYLIMERENSDPQEETVRRALCYHMLLEAENTRPDGSFVRVSISIVLCGWNSESFFCGCVLRYERSTAFQLAQVRFQVRRHDLLSMI